MKVKSDSGTKQHHHYTTKSITIPYVPNGKSRDRIGAGGESRMPEGRGKICCWLYCFKSSLVSPTGAPASSMAARG